MVSPITFAQFVDTVRGCFVEKPSLRIPFTDLARLIGIAPAAVYAAMRGRVPGIDAGRGLGFGFAMFVLEDEVVNPALGVAAPPQRYPWQPHAQGLISHLVYGLVADWVLHALAPKARARAGA